MTKKTPQKHGEMVKKQLEKKETKGSGKIDEVEYAKKMKNEKWLLRNFSLSATNYNIRHDVTNYN